MANPVSAAELAMNIVAKGGDVLHPSVQRALNPVRTYHQDILTAVESLFKDKNKAKVGGLEGIAAALRGNKQIDEYANKYSDIVNKNYPNPSSLDNVSMADIKNRYWYNSNDFPDNITELAALEKMGIPEADLGAVHRLNQIELKSKYPWYNHGIGDINNVNLTNPVVIEKTPLLANTSKFYSMIKEFNPQQRAVLDTLLKELEPDSTASAQALLEMARYI